MSMEIVESDVLIIGSGIAGLRAALEVSRRGRKPLLVSKSAFGRTTNTYLAGGYFALSTDQFPVETHIEKTLLSGRKLNDRPLVVRFVEEAPSLVRELQEMGMAGAYQKNGISSRSSLLVGGPDISLTLIRACRQEGIGFLEGLMVTDLVTRDRTCYGALGFDKRTGRSYGFRSGAVILATGGAGATYAQHDNAPGLTGDGYALGMEAGVELVDMEFVQFYPLVYAGSGPPRMIIPALFADLGRLTNRLGEDLKEKYDLHERPLAIVARDRFSRALFKEIALGNALDGALLLDLQGVQESMIPVKDSLKGRFKKKIAYDRRPIRIAPACHHTMGGLPIDGSCRTALKGLFAAGEVVGGIHGANRMGGNALSESLVFGVLAGRAAAQDPASVQGPAGFMGMVEETAARKEYLSRGQRAKPSIARSLMRRLGQVLWQKVGIIRDEESLREGIESIDGILNEIEEQRASDPREICRILECRNAALTGRATAVAALKRTESRGSHYRDDHPEEKEEWIQHMRIGMVHGLPEVVGASPVTG